MSRSIDEYFSLHQKYEEEYGNGFVLLYQSGKFYEIYGIVEEYDDFENPKYNGSLKHIYDHTSLTISKKGSTKYNEKQVFMAGPPTEGQALQNLKQDLTNFGLVVIIHFQDDKPDNPNIKTRLRKEIYTSAVQDISHDPILEPSKNQVANKFIYCISFYPVLRVKNIKQEINVGISFLSLLTNQSYVISIPIHTLSNKSEWSPINTILQLYPPKEVLIYKPQNLKFNTIQKFLNVLKNTQNYVFDVCHERKHNAPYCRNIINKIFNKQTHQIPSLKQYESTVSVLHSFAKLLEKIDNQCNRLLNNMEQPEIVNNEGKMLLGNDPLVQLNIVDSGLFDDLSKTASKRYKSLYHLLDYHKTPLGKRHSYKRLTQPITDPEKLTQKFKNIISFRKLFTNDTINGFWKGLIGINDIVMYHSKISKEDVSFESMVMYYKQIEKIYHIAHNIKREIESQQINNQDDNRDDNQDEQTEYNELLESLYSWFNYDTIKYYYDEIRTEFENKYDMETYDPRNPDSVRIREGWSYIYDNAFSIINYIRDNLVCISTELNTILQKKRRDAKVELINNDYFEITKNRYDKYLKPYINKNKNKNISLTDGTNIKLSDYEEVPLIKKNKIGLRYNLTNHVEISECEKTCLEEREKIRRDIYLFIKSHNIDEIAEFVSTFDCLCNDIYLIENKGYVLPTLDTKKSSGFVEFEGVSHPIIKELHDYITNNVTFNNEKRGMLLYGVNESGKSSLMKAIGMNIILAQCGMPVCCKSMNFYPYEKMYTRIQSQDNLWLGQSTFNVEIQELNNIINGANDNTIVLADELCSGTEVTSANKILLASLIFLSRKKSHYLFTTHLHLLKKSPRIKECEGLHIYKIPIQYNEEKNEIVYPRKLEEGNSEELYGVMVARANHLPDKFMDLVDSIETNEIRNIQYSKYNSQKRMDKCEVCGRSKNDHKLTIDHNLEQQSANNNGIIHDIEGNRNIHKNHIDNLVCVCSFCHEKKTKGEISYEYVQTNNGKKLVVTELKQNNERDNEQESELDENELDENEVRKKIQKRLKEFVYKRMNTHGEKEIATEFKKKYSKYKKPSVQNIRRIKLNHMNENI
jgi:DNA mismatch repair protein MutS